jgi:hypothetical protein
MKEEHMDEIARLIKTVIENVENESIIEKVNREVLLLCSSFPVPDHFVLPGGKAAHPLSSGTLHA